MMYLDHMDAVEAARLHGHELGPWYAVGSNGRRARCVRCGVELVWTQGEHGDGLACHIRAVCTGWPVRTYRSVARDRRIIHSHLQIDPAWSPLPDPVWSDESDPSS